MNDRDFATVQQLSAQYAGIKLSQDRRPMFERRLNGRLSSLGMTDFGEYLQLLQCDGSHERQRFVNTLTINQTAFFREPVLFEQLAARASEHAQKRGAPLRCWSSACSSGEEAWSIAMVLREANCPGEVLGTDINTDVLQQAQSGLYRKERADRTLSPERLRRHFLRGAGASQGWLSIRPELRCVVRFSQVNLQSPLWPAQERFDVIFCCNVMMYLERDFQKELLARLAALLVPGGLLMVAPAQGQQQ